VIFKIIQQEFEYYKKILFIFSVITMIKQYFQKIIKAAFAALIIQ